MYYVSYLAPRQTKSSLLEPVLDDHKRSFPRHASQLMDPANKPFSSDNSPQGNILKVFLCITRNGHSFLQSLLEKPLNNDNLE